MSKLILLKNYKIIRLIFYVILFLLKNKFFNYYKNLIYYDYLNIGLLTQW